MEPYIGEIRLFAFGKTPTGWIVCDGRLLQVTANAALYSLLGTIYGGDGKSTFGIPDLRGRVPMHYGPSNPIGQSAGTETVTLTAATMPMHTHQVAVNSTAPPATPALPPAGNYWAAAPVPHMSFGPFGTPVAMANTVISTAGADQAHPNMQPFQVLNFCIATLGYYPPQPN